MEATANLLSASGSLHHLAWPRAWNHTTIARRDNGLRDGIRELRVRWWLLLGRGLASLQHCHHCCGAEDGCSAALGRGPEAAVLLPCFLEPTPCPCHYCTGVPWIFPCPCVGDEWQSELSTQKNHSLLTNGLFLTNKENSVFRVVPLAFIEKRISVEDARVFSFLFASSKFSDCLDKGLSLVRGRERIRGSRGAPATSRSGNRDWTP